MLPGLCGIRVRWCVCPGLTVGDGVLRLGEEDGLTTAVLLLCLCVVAGMCGNACGSDDMCLCMPDLHVSWGLRVGVRPGECWGCGPLECVRESLCVFVWGAVCVCPA